MKLGVHIGYWGLGLSSEDQLHIVQEAERLGYDSVWTAEAYGSDAATVLGWLAGQTSRIRLGSGIFQMPGRSAAMTAMTAATIDQLSGGRMILGIGSSGPQVAEGWHGQRFAKQLQRTREYVAGARVTSCVHSSRSTSAAWARASRTSTTSSSAATASATLPSRSRTCTWTASATRPWQRSPMS